MPRGSGKLTDSQKAWADAYKRCGSPKLAAKLAGYGGNDATLATIGQNNLKNKKIQEYLKNIYTPEVMEAPEIRARLARQARASAEVFLTESGNIDINKLYEADALDLIKDVKIKKRIFTDDKGNVDETIDIHISLHDAQGALDKLARMEGLYKDKVQLSGEIQHEHTHRVTVEPTAIGEALDILAGLGLAPTSPAPAAVDTPPPPPQAARGPSM